MSKYQDIMNKIEVTDEMKSRILQNIEKEIGAEGKEPDAKAPEDSKDKGTVKGADSGSGLENRSDKIRKFEFRKYMPMAAALAVFVLSAYVVINVIPAKHANYSSTPMTDSASEAPMATETAAEPAMEMAAEEAIEEAAEAPMAAEEAMETEEAMPAEEAAEYDAAEEAMPVTEAEPATESAIKEDNAAGNMKGELSTQTTTSGTLAESDKEKDAVVGSSPNATLTNQPVTGGAEQEAIEPATSADTVKPVVEPQPKLTFFGKIARFFKNLFEAIKGLFK